MGTQIDIVNAQKLAESLSREMLEKFLRERTVLSGEEILSFTNISELNYLIIREIFTQWNNETSKLSSPYFDYSHPQVKKALADFLNTLSSHISIKLNDFIAIFKKALSNFIILIANPGLVISSFYPNQHSIKVQDLEGDKKFIKLNKFLFDELVVNLKNENKTTFTMVEGQEFIIKVIEKNAHKLESNQEVQEKIQFFQKELDNRDAVAKELQVPTTSQIDSIMPIVNAIPKPQIKSTTQGSQAILNDSLQPSENTIIDRLSKTKIQSIKEEITLIKKFLFLNGLFNGSNEDYARALEIADNGQTYDETMSQLKDEFGKKHTWAEDDEALLEFQEILKRKYDQ